MSGTNHHAGWADDLSSSIRERTRGCVSSSLATMLENARSSSRANVSIACLTDLGAFAGMFTRGPSSLLMARLLIAIWIIRVLSIPVKKKVH